MRGVRRMLGLVALTTGLGLAQFLIIPGMEPKLSIGLFGVILTQIGINALCLGTGAGACRKRCAQQRRSDLLSTVFSR